METTNECVVKKTSSSEVTNPLFITHQFISHHPKAGINPLVDAAAYLFSCMGKLKQLRTYRDLPALQKELINKIIQCHA